MAGQKIDADTALAWGLLDRVVERDRLEAEAALLAADALGAAPDHVAAIKSLCRAG